MAIFALNAPEQTLISLFNIEAKLDILNEMIIEVLAEQRGTDMQQAKDAFNSELHKRVQALIQHYQNLSQR